MQGTLRNVGQQPDSYDCGYFAGYALNLVHQHGSSASSVSFSQDDVYAARNRYLGQKLEGPMLNSSRSINSVLAMQNYLGGLGRSGKYTSKYYGMLKDEKALRKLLIDSVPEYGSKQGALLSLGSIMEGHWVCVLGYGLQNGVNAWPKLWNGMPNPKVPALQIALNRLARPQQMQLTVDGKFGSNTETRVREFQTQSGIGVDGIVGRGTWAELDKRLGGSGNQELYFYYDPYPTHSHHLLGLTTESFLGLLSRVGVSLLIWPG